MRTLQKLLIPCLLASAIAAAPGFLRAQSTDLIPRGAEWRYFKGTVAPPAGWKEIGFDDSSWIPGIAGIGYGDGDDRTVLTDMQNNYMAIFARRTFQVDDPAAVNRLSLRICVDDGFVAYLNGAEATRAYMGAAGDPVAFDGPAITNHENTGFENFDVNASLPSLAAGTNVLAVEVHNFLPGSEDLTFDPQLSTSPYIPTGKLPPNFIQETYLQGFDALTTIQFTPDGRIFLAEKRGTIWIVQDGVRIEQPLLSISGEVNNAADRGLLGLAIDPGFAENGFIYLLYVVDPIEGSPEESGDAISFGRLTRYRVEGNTADPGSRTILIGHTAADGFPSCHSSHAIGSVRFGLDGSLFVSAGDGAHFDFADGGQDLTPFDPDCAAVFGTDEDVGALRSQRPDSLDGKILRLDPASGLGLPDNPFYNGDPTSVRSRTWVSGLRNPFRFTFRPGTPGPGAMYLGDVGWISWEELNVAKGGENFGWPCFEGLLKNSDYGNQSTTGPECRAMASDQVTPPLLTWNHTIPGLLGMIGNCSVGGVFYTGTRYPGRYRGAFFFADYGLSWIKVAFVDDQDRLLAFEDFASELDRPVDLQLDPTTGDLLYVSIQTAEVRRIRYISGNLPPDVIAGAAPSSGNAPLPVLFSSAGTSDPDGDPLEFDWNFGDGTPHSALAEIEHTYAIRGQFTAVLTVRDGRGGESSRSFVIDASNAPPEVAITRPQPGFKFFGGEVIQLQAMASDLEDGAAVALRWQVDLIHENHTHPQWFVSNEAEPLFTLMSHGGPDEDFSYEIQAIATDSKGSSTTAAVIALPGSLRRGDGNRDDAIDIADPVALLLHLFLGREPACALALDADADGELAIADAVYLLQFLFLSGAAPAAPYPECGVTLNVQGIPCGAGCP